MVVVVAGAAAAAAVVVVVTAAAAVVEVGVSRVEAVGAETVGQYLTHGCQSVPTSNVRIVEHNAVTLGKDKCRAIHLTGNCVPD